MAKTTKKPKAAKKPPKKGKVKPEPKPIDYSSPEVIRAWDDEYLRNAQDLAARHKATFEAYLEMKDALPKLKKRVEALAEERQEAEERWRRYRGHKPPATQGTLDTLKPEREEKALEQPAPAPQALPAAATPTPTGWFPEDLWKKVPIERWEKYGLTPEVIEKMKAGAGKGGKRTVPPIHTVGDIAGFSQPYPNDPTFINQFGHIKGIGAETATKIETAQEQFWKDWNDGYATAFALEQGYQPKEGASDAGKPGDGKENPGGGDTGDTPKRKGGRPRKAKAATVAEPTATEGSDGEAGEETEVPE